MAKEKKLQELESKLETIQKQLEKFQHDVNELFAKLEIDESARRGSRDMKRRFEAIHYFQALSLGLFLGLLGDFAISSLMKVLEPLSPNWFLLLDIVVAIIVLFLCLFLVAIGRILKQ